MTVEDANKELNTILKNQARLKATRLAENIVDKSVTKAEAQKVLEGFSALEKAELFKAIEKLAEEEQK